MNNGKVWARRAFHYDGIDLDRGQIITLHGCKNDEQLTRIGYLMSVEKSFPGLRISVCGICSAEFISNRELDYHGDKTHTGQRDRETRDATPEEKRALIQNLSEDPLYVPPVSGESLSDPGDAAQNPLYMDRTKASLASSMPVDITPPTPTPVPAPTPPTPPTPPVLIPEDLTGADLKKWRRGNDFTQDVAASVLGVSTNAVKRAEKLEGSLGHRLGPAFRKVLRQASSPA